MFDVPVDSMAVWVGLGLVSLVVFGLAASVPTAPPPDASAVADTVDAVAASPHASTAAQPIAADAVRLSHSRVALRSDGGTAAAVFRFGKVTPVADGTPLDRVLHGRPPSRVFSSAAAFERALRRARQRPARWRPAADRVLVRRVFWRGVRATLVGA